MPSPSHRRMTVAVHALLLTSLVGPLAAAQQSPLAARVDPYVAKPRVLVLTDIANEPDDQMSLVRLLVYSNQLDLAEERAAPRRAEHRARRVRPGAA